MCRVDVENRTLKTELMFFQVNITGEVDNKNLSLKVK